MTRVVSLRSRTNAILPTYLLASQVLCHGTRVLDDALTSTLMRDPDEQRSWNMARIRSRDTGPELFVRSTLHRLGFRYRVNRGGLPGRPDLAFPSRRRVIFVHGCFWHGHSCARGRSVPKSNKAFWIDKIRANVYRDAQNAASLQQLGWRVLVVWECELRDKNWLKRALRFLRA